MPRVSAIPGNPGFPQAGYEFAGAHDEDLMNMGYAALTSGGKDSILSIQKAPDSGLAVSHVVTVRPDNPDSFMSAGCFELVIGGFS